MMTKKKFAVASLSALVQYYDYHLFGFLAAKVAKNFFSEGDTSLILLKTYFLMFIAVLSKPIGAVVLGRIGDLYGRQKTINIGIIITAIASFIISILPSYEQIGMLAPIILLLGRMCITSCASSGSDGVRLYIYEKISKTKKNLGSGLTTISTIGGSFLASASAWFFTLELFPSYFWRFAYLSGAIAGVLVVIIRNFLVKDEDLNLETESNYEQYKDMPLWQILKQNILLFSLCVIIAGGIGASYQFNFVFWGTFNSEILKNIDESSMQFYRSVGIILYMVFAVIGGLIADLTSPRATATVAILGIIALGSINCYFISQNNLSISIYLLSSALLPFITMPALTLLKSSIPKVIRYRLFSLSHSMGSIIISAPTAVISTCLYRETKISWLPISYHIIIMIMMLISMSILFSLKKNAIAD
jgi:MFS family permease